MVDDGMGGWGSGRDSKGLKGQRVQADGGVLIAIDLHRCICGKRGVFFFKDITQFVICSLVGIVTSADFLFVIKEKQSEKNQILADASLRQNVLLRVGRENHLLKGGFSEFKPSFQALDTQLGVE